ncbi:alpha/beta hydrolase fold domain-containing protein [Nocardioides speluncae]|uniref:alpha/beta hydrolase fold domain-containing protein n=1 Tax=Nocardioides speluncae TaxID=2670337 RepID=UPI000D695ECF|nr:alpha/beta hydrolase fold domain-containing protein [Nocardioides speluncae]
MDTDPSDSAAASGRLIDLPKAPDAIELRHLRFFLAVAEELNFTRAAERLYLTQPALSRQIRALERLLDVELLSRSTHHVELTVAGQALLNRVRPLLTDLDDAVQHTRAVGGENQQRLERLTQPIVDQLLTGLDAFRQAFEAMNAQLPTPDGVATRPVNAGGVPALVYTSAQAATADPTADSAADPAVIYIHGGGYLSGSAFGSRPLAGILSVTCASPVLVPDYRLAPEHPYPAAVDDVERSYGWLAGRAADPAGLALVADSSGAGLVMSLLQRLRATGAAMPGTVVLLSPWVDLECLFLDHETEGDPQARAVRDQVDMCVPTYLGTTSPADPAVNPLHADLTGLPPMLVQVGTGDFVLRDAKELVGRAREHGVPATLELYPANTHVFHLFWSFLPEAAKAIEAVGAHVRAMTNRTTGLGESSHIGTSRTAT